MFVGILKRSHKNILILCMKSIKNIYNTHAVPCTICGCGSIRIWSFKPLKVDMRISPFPISQFTLLKFFITFDSIFTLALQVAATTLDIRKIDLLGTSLCVNYWMYERNVCIVIKVRVSALE